MYFQNKTSYLNTCNKSLKETNFWENNTTYKSIVIICTRYHEKK